MLVCRCAPPCNGCRMLWKTVQLKDRARYRNEDCKFNKTAVCILGSISAVGSVWTVGASYNYK